MLSNRIFSFYLLTREGLRYKLHMMENAEATDTGACHYHKSYLAVTFDKLSCISSADSHDKTFDLIHFDLTSRC